MLRSLVGSEMCIRDRPSGSLVTRLENRYKPITEYHDGKYRGSREDREQKLRTSSTMYIGNLSFFTTEEQCMEFFSKCGLVKQVVIGLDRYSMSPCGFGFVEYRNRSDAEVAMGTLNKALLDGMNIRLDWDPGFSEERRYGRGRNGFQVRDEFRERYDPNRPLPRGRDHDRDRDRDRGPRTPRGTSWDKDGRRGSKRPREDDRGTRSADGKRARENNPRFREEEDDSKSKSDEH
eukprot:TRINITY_DN5357_c0_g1_i2.p1 TRINITY_DN5357_c0_g1~~TRINITY_DN5357_c0_g1_i2.p1  ORF type:complete len:234 (-),score=58.92 TRINITY_DN5357_c0_g1_i2:233-934(-)